MMKKYKVRMPCEVFTGECRDCPEKYCPSGMRQVREYYISMKRRLVKAEEEVKCLKWEIASYDKWYGKENLEDER
jgi:hypothetical protein